MTDELFEKILAHVREHHIPPMPPMFSDGCPITILVDESIYSGEPELLPSVIRMSWHDYSDLRQRIYDLEKLTTD